MRIGITYNLKEDFKNKTFYDQEMVEELDSKNTIVAIKEALREQGHQVSELGGGLDIIDKIKANNIEYVFNIAEGYSGRNRESQIPAILEMLNLPYSGSDPLTLGLCLDKILAKKILNQSNIPTPAFAVVQRIQDLKLTKTLNYPLITKPAWEGSSKGIYDCSKVFKPQELEKNLQYLFKKYPRQPVLVEEYIEGRELTVGVIGNESPRVLGIMEISYKDNNNKDFFYSLEVKRNWKELVRYQTSADISLGLENKIKTYALRVFKEFSCRDFARVDFKVSRQDKAFLLEVNPLAGLSPQYSDLVIMAKSLGISYRDLIISILKESFLRLNIGNKKDALFKKNLV